MSCNSSHACVAATSQDNPNGRCAGTCDASGACKSKQGQVCNTVAAGCVSGTTCSPDGYCCDTACTGPCVACDLTGQQGTCKPIGASNTPHTNHGTCAGAGTPCAGSCDGAGNCNYPTGTCGGGRTCSGTSLVGQSTCSAGSCVPPAAQACAANLVCSASACKTSCTADADCVSGYFCETAACRLVAVAIAAGEEHTCALLGDGTVRCWGNDAYGDLGNGTFSSTPSPTPTVVTGLPNPATAIASEGLSTCALLNDGTVWCWGWNYYGGLGQRNLHAPTGNLGIACTDPGPRSAECRDCHHLRIFSLLRDRGRCALLLGLRRIGPASGNGVFTSSAPNGVAMAAAVNNLGSSVTAVAGGDNHTCAIKSGTLSCWGDNTYGQVGNGTTGTQYATSQVVSLTNAPLINAISTGGNHSCLLFAGGYGLLLGL